ncbi:MAG TPA: DbpA RNA binding domain-containing protein, partial [Steroidobacteraceae bacterium]
PARGQPLATFRIEIGHTHGVKPGQIVGAIANEAGLAGAQIGRIDIRDTHSFIDLPAAMPRATLRSLARVRVAGHLLRLSREDDKTAAQERGPARGAGERTRPRRWDP